MHEEIGPGRVVTSLAGRDAGRFYIVLGVSDGRVLVVDGLSRRVQNAKRKNPRHLRACSYVAEEVRGKVARGERVTDAEIRRALQAFLEKEGGK
ncbi:MAG: KOW domain-containing RNA-binding protein [Bacillota bacterium]